MGQKRKRVWTFTSCCHRRRETHYADNERVKVSVVRTGLEQRLIALVPAIKEVYMPCRTSYLDATGQWNISCYAELDDLPDAMVPGAVVHPPMALVLQPLLDGLTARLFTWWLALHPEFSGFELHRVQTFVTRYSVHRGETHLTRHVDGPHVDASFILQLHSERFTGGGVRVWDSENGRDYTDYALETGDLCMLDHLVWHQSLPVTSGERWVLVVFCQKRPKRPKLHAERSTARCQKAIALATSAATATCEIDEEQAQALAHMLSSSGMDERERAAFTVGCLAASSASNQTTIVDSGALPLLVDMLRTPAPPLSKERGWAAAALARLATNNSKNKAMIADLGAIPTLVEMLSSEQDLEAEEAASALCNLSANNEANKHLISMSGAVSALVKCLGGAKPKQRIWSACTLSNLATDPVICGQIWRAGAIERLVHQLHSDTSKERRRAAAALASLARGEPSTHSAILAAGVRPVLEAMLRDAEESIEATSLLEVLRCHGEKAGPEH